MKKQIIALLVPILYQTTGFASNLEKYQSAIAQIKALEQSNRKPEAIVLALRASDELAREIGFDQVVANLDSSVNEIRQEVVTETVRQNAGFNFLFGLFSGSANRNYNITRIINTNAQEVAEFDRKQGLIFQKMKNQLRNFVVRNELPIFYAKVFTAKALQLAVSSQANEVQNLLPLINQMSLRVSRIQFHALNNVTRCQTLNHASYTNESAVSISSFLLSFGLSNSEQKNAYSETTCAASSNQAQISENEVFSPMLSIADSMIEKNQKELSLKILIQSEAPSFPTWGSPYYK